MSVQPSLYEKLGGAPAVEKAVEIFYRKVLADPRVNHFFEGVDMEKQIAKQRAFMTMAFGGPNEYTGRNMREAHERLVKEKGLNDTHVDVIIEHLRSTLEELGVAPELIEEVIQGVESLRDEVLGRA